MGTTAPSFDMLEIATRIERAQEETRKFAAEQHKLTAETIKLGAEAAKLSAEAGKLNRDRILAPLVLVAGVAGGMIAGGLSLLAKLL